MRQIEVGKIYKHFKGHIYKVIAIAYDSEAYSDDNPRRFVVYQEMQNDNKIWAREYNMFNSLVDKEKYPEVTQKYRFEEIND